jgi:hypothetical protein
VLMLWAAAMEKGYSCPTYKQAAELERLVVVAVADENARGRCAHDASHAQNSL